jgi:hypothetical protein
MRVEPERVPTSTAFETVSDEDRFVIGIDGGQLNYFFPDSDRALATARKVCDMLNRHESYETIAYYVANRSATSALSHEDAAGFIGLANVTIGEH